MWEYTSVGVHQCGSTPVWEYTSVGVHNQSPGEIKRRGVSWTWTLTKKSDTSAGPDETRRREVELDPQVSPEEIESREVELGLRDGLL